MNSLYLIKNDEKPASIGYEYLSKSNKDKTYVISVNRSQIRHMRRAKRRYELRTATQEVKESRLSKEEYEKKFNEGLDYVLNNYDETLRNLVDR